jgi:hypothetical protein
MKIDCEFMELFKATFKGRDDVVPCKWQSGNSYSPLCRNAGREDLCQKPCKTCPHKDYVPWDDDLLMSHIHNAVDLSTGKSYNQA